MSCMKRVWRRMFGKKQMRVLLLGLDAAGKTTTLYALLGKNDKTVPTIGYNVETVSFPPIELLVWDVSGQERLRSFWRHYYHATCGVIFVVDSSDSQRFPLVRRELHGLLGEEELSNAVVLILANKCDQAAAVSNEQLAKELELEVLDEGKRPYHVQRTVATTGEGLKEGLTWLAKTMKPHGEK